jgi:hypothetical protein
VTGTSSFDVEETRVASAATWTPATTAVKALTGLKPGPGNPGAVTATGTPDGFVHVAPFAAIIQSSRAANAGTYTLTVDATVDINVLATPANATNPRNDLVIAHTPDTFYGDANSTPVVRTVVGTPSGSPADPSLAAFPDAVTLARVRVNANATTITTGNITDLRPPHTVAVGGVLPTNTATTRNALTGIYDGLTVYRRDRNWLETHDGSAYRVHSLPVVSSEADLSAITNPSAGTAAYNTGDGHLYRYTGSAWRVHGVYRTTTKLPSPAPSVTLTIPTYLRDVRIQASMRTTASAATDEIYLRINDVSTSNYVSTTQYTATVTNAASNNPSGTEEFLIGRASGSLATAGNYSPATIDLVGWNDPHATLGCLWQSFCYPDAPANAWLFHGGGIFTADGPYTTVTLLPNAPTNFATNSQFTVTGHE